MKKTILLLALMFFAINVFAQETEHLSYKVFTNRDSYSAKDTIKLGIKVKIKEKKNMV